MFETSYWSSLTAWLILSFLTVSDGVKDEVEELVCILALTQLKKITYLTQGLRCFLTNLLLGESLDFFIKNFFNVRLETLQILTAFHPQVTQILNFLYLVSHPEQFNVKLMDSLLCDTASSSHCLCKPLQSEVRPRMWGP